MAVVSGSLALRNYSLYQQGVKSTGSSLLLVQLHGLAGVKQDLAPA